MFGFSALTIAVVIAALLAIVGSYFAYHTWHNPVEEKMAEIIEHEVGVDIDNYLPTDSTTEAAIKAATGASATSTTSTEKK